MVKSYLKTTSGAKELSRRLSQHLIVNLIETYEKNKSSEIKDKLQGKLRALRSESQLNHLSSKEQEQARFLFAGKDEDYQKDKVLKKSREILEQVLNEVLKNLNFSDEKSTFKQESHGDPFMILFSKFWDHVLEDYLNYERPIPFRKLTWKYDTKSRGQDIKDLFTNPDSSLPSNASYHFPFVSKESEDKFQNFLKAINVENPNSEKLKAYSDDKNIDLVIPISSIVEGKYTSQFSIAILEVFRYLIGNEWSPTLKEKFLRNSNSSKYFKCEHKTDGIPSISLEKDKKTSDLFCLKKGKSNRDSENIVSDFIYLIQKQEKQLSWILFKDKEGIHALTYNSEAISKEEYKSDKFKKHLKNAGYFDLKENLVKHLNKHFERLILSYWDKFPEQQQQQQAKELSNFLLRDFFSQHLVLLRKVLLKDYLDMFNSSFEKKNVWQSAFAGRFPYKFFKKEGDFLITSFESLPDAKDTFDWKMIPHLEDNFLLQLKPNLAWASDAFLKVKSKFEGYSKNIDDLFSQQSQQIKWKDFKFFKFGVGVSSVASQEAQMKKIENEDLFNSVWISLLQDDKLAEILFKEKIRSEVKYFDFENLKKDSIRSIGDLYSSEFKGLNKLQNTENLIFNYLHSEYIDLNKDQSIPQVLGYFNFGKVNEKTKLQSFFQKTIKKFKVTLSSKATDVSNGGMLTDLFTIKWLAKDNFENFRKHLRKTLKRDKLSAFVFSKKFSEKDKCLPNTRDKTKIFENLELQKSNQTHSFIFRNATGNKDKDLTCPISSDIVNFALVDVEDGKGVKYLTGYKGLISGDWKTHFPEDISDKLQTLFPLWKDSNSLINYIEQSVHGDDKYNELIQTLKSLFPQYNWDFDIEKRCFTSNFNWQTVGRGVACTRKTNTSFNEKKDLLKNYLRQQDQLDSNASYSRLVNNGSNLLDDSLFVSKNGWVTDENGNYLIKSSDGSQYQIYLVQIKYDDVENEESWKNYLKTIDSSYFFKELIKTAKDSKVKQQALLDGLTSNSGILKDFKTGDDRLRRTLGYSWLKSIRS